MALRRLISYQLQLFIPLVTMLWLVIFGMGFWQVQREKEYRADMMRDQLTLISARIINAYEQDLDVQQFMHFVGKYYKESPAFDEIRISVYDTSTGDLIYSTGRPIELTDDEKQSRSGITYNPDLADEDSDIKENSFFYSVSKSPDKKLTIYTVLPFNENITAASLPNTNVWIIVLAMALFLSVLGFFSTRYFGRNIKLLKSMADRAATDPTFIPAVDFPHDELGDISRQIVHIYNERTKAVVKLKREHRIAMHALDEKNRLRRQLINNINHELKTPIGVIKGYLDTIVQNPDMDASSRNHFIERSLDHANRLATLIADVSEMTRLEEGGQQICTEPVDFHDVVYTVSNDVEESGAIGNLEFVYDVPLGCMVEGNFNLLTGMIMNLTKNAVAYSRGTECGIVYNGEDEKFCHFTYYDNGRGVDERHIPHLFERFYRIDSGRSRKMGGTGLGLPIVQNVVLAHGGTISVRNRDEGGLAFDFSLAKARTKTSAEPAPDEA